MRNLAVPALAALTLLLGHGAEAAGYKPAVVNGAAITVKTVASGFTMPLYLTAPAGDPRLFVLEKGGLIKIVKDGTTLPAPFLDLSASIKVDLSAGLGSDNYQGLLGLAFDPDFASNGKFYVDYTPNGQIVVAAGHAAPGADVADAALTPLLSIDNPKVEHNGGWLGFGPDGKLYVAVGDGSAAGDKPNHAQTPTDLLGKILRLDVDKGGAPEVFALGVRNPWRASFDGTSLYIGDLGQEKFGEIDVLSVGDKLPNLGWRVMEADKCFLKLSCDKTGLTLPIDSGDHSLACAVTGGYVYRGKAIPALAGRYLFGDYCTGVVTALTYAGGKSSDIQSLGFTFSEQNPLTSFGTDGEGEIYLLTENGKINKIVPAE